MTDDGDGEVTVQAGPEIESPKVCAGIGSRR
jgi:hypothetical protein